MMELPDTECIALAGSVFTHRGRRARNEDSGRIVPLPNGGMAAIVCDGMGGNLAGDYASAHAADSLAEALRDGREPVAAIEEINARLHHQSCRDASKAGMGTTLVVAIAAEGTCTFFNVGDSRGYLNDPDLGLIQVTRDHSYVEAAVDAGELTREQAETSRYRNALTRALATEPQVNIDISGPHRMRSGAVVLLCTDGIYRVLDEAMMEGRLDIEPENAASRLAVDACTRGSDDNVTAAVLWWHPVVSDDSPHPENTTSHAEARRILDAIAPNHVTSRDQRSKAMGSGHTNRRRLTGAILALLGAGAIAMALLPAARGIKVPLAPATTSSDTASGAKTIGSKNESAVPRESTVRTVPRSSSRRAQSVAKPQVSNAIASGAYRTDTTGKELEAKVKGESIASQQPPKATDTIPRQTSSDRPPAKQSLIRQEGRPNLPPSPIKPGAKPPR